MPTIFSLENLNVPALGLMKVAALSPLSISGTGEKSTAMPSDAAHSLICSTGQRLLFSVPSNPYRYSDDLPR